MDVKTVLFRSENKSTPVREEMILLNRGFSNCSSFKGHLDGCGGHVNKCNFLGSTSMDSDSVGLGLAGICIFNKSYHAIKLLTQMVCRSYFEQHCQIKGNSLDWPRECIPMYVCVCVCMLGGR